MNLLSDIITYIRRIIKSPSNAVISDNLLIDYINRFWIMDVDAEIQLFDLKTKYQFQTQPGVDQYNMPLYQIQSEGSNPTSSINYYPMYQGFINPAFINGIQVPMQSEQSSFYNIWPNIVQQLPVVAVGNGTNGPYTFTFPIVANFNMPPNPPLNGILRGHVDIEGIIDFASSVGGSFIDPPVVSTLNTSIPSTSVDSKVWITTLAADGSNVVVTDSGQFQIGNVNNGLLMTTGPGTEINALLNGYGTSGSPNNVVNYLTGTVTNLYFPVTIPLGNNINANCFFFQSGLPRGILFYNNSLILRSPPDQQYLVELTAYLSPAAYLNSSSAVQFAYMAEYIARGAARKILSDTGDWEQFNAYEKQFMEQKALVWKRSQRQFTNTRTTTIYSEGTNQGQSGFNNIGGSTL